MSNLANHGYEPKPPHAKYPPSVNAGIPRLASPKRNWQVVKIGELFEEVVRPAKLENCKQYSLVTVKRSRGGVIAREHLSGSQIAVKSQFFVEEGDFLISKRQIVHGACGFVPANLDGSIVSNEYSVLQCAEGIIPEFINYLSYTPYFQQTCFHSSIGVHVEKMIFKLDEWFRWPIPVPNEEEQQKIAKFLCEVDKKLDKLRRKHELLNDYKRGLMQKLFSQEIRFKQSDGSDFPDWEEIAIDQLFTFLRTNSLSREKLTTEKTNLQNIHYGDIHKKHSARFILSESNAPYVKDQNIIHSLNDEEFCHPGDLVIADASEDYADIGKAIEIIEAPEKTLVAGLHTILARPINSYLALGFSAYLFQSPTVRKAIMRIAQGISVLGISKRELCKIRIKTPKPNEQQKIANCLSAIDQKIEAVGRHIKQVETFKKGLLQQMFV